MNSDKTEKIMESYYKYIGEAHVDNILKALEDKKEEIERVNVPTTLDQWFENFVNEGKRLQKKKKRARYIKKISSRAAIVILLLIASLSLVTFTVEAVRVRVFNFFMETNDKYTEVRVEEGADPIPNDVDWDGYYYPSYLTEGYSFYSYEEAGVIRIINFASHDKVLIFTQAMNGTDFQLDTEDGVATEENINGNKGVLIIKEDKSLLFWNNNDTSFCLLGQIDKDEILRIAKNIEKK